MNGITEKQKYAYFRAFGQACSELGLTGSAKEEYRHRVMLEECGKGSIKELDRTNDFDKVMCRFLIDAGDPLAASKYSIGDDRRLVRMVEVCAYQCSQILGTDMPSAAAYVAGILRKAGYRISSPVNGTFWMDIASQDLFAVFQMLDTYRRRLMHGFGLADGTKITYNIRASYGRELITQRVTMTVSDPPPPAYFQVGKPA